VIDNNNLSGTELKYYLKIARHSFGYKHRWCYLRYTSFGSDKKTVSKNLKSLEEIGLISKELTYKTNGHKGMNKYKILEPKGHIDNFIFLKEDKKTKTVSPKEDFDGW